MPDLIVERDGAVVIATLNRPARKNAITREMFESLRELFEAVERSEEDRALVLRGAGGEFCSGIDLTVARAHAAHEEDQAASMARINATALALHELTTPTVAAVDGVAVGAGMSLAMGCDVVVASRRARFNTIFVRRGLSLDFGLSWLLPRLVGMARAKQLALLGEFVDADEALGIGLVADVVEPGDLDGAARAIARRLADGPSVAIGQDLSLLDGSASRSFAEALDAEAESQARCIASADGAEAIQSFLDKRDPRFTGR